MATGVGFLDHMLEQLSRHSLIDLEVQAKGDIHIDFHHLTEDTGIAIGEAVAYAISPFSAEARAAIEANKRANEVTGTIAIKIDSEGRPRVTQLQSTGVDLATSATYTGSQGF